MRGCDNLTTVLTAVRDGTETPATTQRAITTVLADKKNDLDIFHATFTSNLKALYVRAETLLTTLGSTPSVGPSGRH